MRWTRKCDGDVIARLAGSTVDLQLEVGRGDTMQRDSINWVRMYLKTPDPEDQRLIIEVFRRFGGDDRLLGVRRGVEWQISVVHLRIKKAVGESHIESRPCITWCRPDLGD